MADLITNLQSIYNTKLQIKEAIGTESDIFADYPSYISDLKPEGYTYITMNGDHSVNGYAYVNVAVPGATEYDHIDISANSQVDVSAYNYAYVSVPVPPGYIIPEGTINIETVGTHDVTAYASAYVDIQVPTYVFGYQTITNNGVAYASSYGLDGFTYVDVQVPTSGGSSHSGQSTADAWTIEDAYAYISAFEDTNEHTNIELGFEPVIEGVVASVLPNRNYSSQYPTARFWITRDGSAVAADYSNAILCWNMQSNLAATWTEGIDMQIYPGQHVFVQCTKLQKYLDSNTGNYQMECKNGTAIVRQTSANGQLTITQSGTYDTTTYVSAYVDVQGGGGADTFSVTGVWMANAISDGVNTYQMMNSNNLLLGGLDSYSFGTYVSGNIISIFSNDCLTKWQNGNEIYYEDADENYQSSIVATAGTFNWDVTNQVVNGQDNFYWNEQNFGPVTRKNYKFTDNNSGVTYLISAADYNTYNSVTANLIINSWFDTESFTYYAAIVGTDA